jgi:hypothetical protein
MSAKSTLIKALKGPAINTREDATALAAATAES